MTDSPEQQQQALKRQQQLQRLQQQLQQQQLQLQQQQLQQQQQQLTASQIRAANKLPLQHGTAGGTAVLVPTPPTACRSPGLSRPPSLLNIGVCATAFLCSNSDMTFAAIVPS